jgi:hypothetical protein
MKIDVTALVQVALRLPAHQYLAPLLAYRLRLDEGG